ncbi:MAG: hypothetical protein JO247_20900 [Chloroflexi bacterium]|nr:hypothetical protein [Chloroflexota bacterium]
MSLELLLCDDRLLWDSQLSGNLWPASLALPMMLGARDSQFTFGDLFGAGR